MFISSSPPYSGALVLKCNIHSDSNPATVARVICANLGMQLVMVNGGTVTVSFWVNKLRLTCEAGGILRDDVIGSRLKLQPCEDR